MDSRSPKERLHMIPHLIGEPINKYDIWHSSNYHQLDYLDYLDEEITAQISPSELEWMKDCHNSPEFLNIRTRYIEIYKQLLTVEEIDERRTLLAEANSLLDSLSENPNFTEL